MRNGKVSTKERARIQPEEKLLNDKTSVGEAAFLILHQDLARLKDKAEAVMHTDDPEAVHDMRVAARRLRAGIQTFAAFLPPSITSLSGDLDWVFKCLGQVRDLDIEIERFGTWRLKAKPDKCGAEDLRNRVTADRNRARASLRRALQSDRYMDLVSKLTAAVQRGPTAGKELASVPVLAVAPDLIRERFRRAKRVGSKLDESSPSVEIHELRKRAKKLRYTLDFFDDLYGKRSRDMIDHLKVLQDLLGSRQDDVISGEHLAKIVKENDLPRETRAVAKQATKSYTQEAKVITRNLTSTLEDAFGKPWKRLDKNMKKRRRFLWKA